MWTEELFQVKKPVIALLHLRALPGDPLYDREGGLKQVVDIARRELHALQDGGVDGAVYKEWRQMVKLAYRFPYYQIIDGGEPQMLVSWAVRDGVKLDAASLAALAEFDAENDKKIFGLEPYYIRRSEAEELWEKKHKQQ